MSNITNQFVANGGNLFPPYNQLNNKINENYSIAAAYYKGREEAFRSILAKQGVSSLEQYSKALSEKAKMFSSEIIAKAKDRIKKAFDAGMNLQQVKAAANERLGNAKSYSFEVAVDDVIANTFSAYTVQHGPNAGNFDIKSAEGFTFERWMGLGIIPPELETETNKVANAVTLFVTGKIKNMAATVKGNYDIRSDLAATGSGRAVGDKEQFEMTSVLNIENFNDYSPEEVGQQLLNAIISNNYGRIGAGGKDFDLFGFQLKAYEGSSDSSRWQQSQPLAAALNEIYAPSRGDPPVTWSSNYAALYPYYFLSKYVLNIVNPVNVGIITKDGLEYTSEFLDHYRFYLEVSWNWKIKHHDPAPDYRGGGEEVANISVMGTKNSTTVLLREVKKGLTLKYQGKYIKSSQRKIYKKVAQVTYS